MNGLQSRHKTPPNQNLIIKEFFSLRDRGQEITDKDRRQRTREKGRETRDRSKGGKGGGSEGVFAQRKQGLPLGREESDMAHRQMAVY